MILYAILNVYKQIEHTNTKTLYNRAFICQPSKIRVACERQKLLITISQHIYIFLRFCFYEQLEICKNT